MLLRGARLSLGASHGRRGCAQRQVNPIVSTLLGTRQSNPPTPLFGLAASLTRRAGRPRCLLRRRHHRVLVPRGGGAPLGRIGHAGPRGFLVLGVPPSTRGIYRLTGAGAEVVSLRGWHPRP